MNLRHDYNLPFLARPAISIATGLIVASQALPRTSVKNPVTPVSFVNESCLTPVSSIWIP
jgi:hypothetical protein